MDFLAKKVSEAALQGPDAHHRRTPTVQDPRDKLRTATVERLVPQSVAFDVLEVSGSIFANFVQTIAVRGSGKESEGFTRRSCSPARGNEKAAGTPEAGQGTGGNNHSGECLLSFLSERMGNGVCVFAAFSTKMLGRKFHREWTHRHRCKKTKRQCLRTQ